jgi:hypothetical protein
MRILIYNTKPFFTIKGLNDECTVAVADPIGSVNLEHFCSEEEASYSSKTWV